MAGIYIEPKDLQLIEGHDSYIGAWKSYNTIRESVGKKTGQKITIPEYCEAEGVKLETIFKILQVKRNLQLCLL